MSSKINDILRRYHICIKVDSQRQCYKLFMSSFFVVWLVNDIVELELSFFFLNKYLSLEMTNRVSYVLKNLQHFASIPHFHKI